MDEVLIIEYGFELYIPSTPCIVEERIRPGLPHLMSSQVGEGVETKSIGETTWS